MRKNVRLQQENFKKNVLSVMFLTILFAVYFFTNGSVASAATLYMGPEETYKNLQDAMAAMSSGDTLIIRDGIYTGEENVIDEAHQPPNGSPSTYTIIKAEHAGQVVFDGEYKRRMFAIRRPGACYMQFEGLIWAHSNNTNLVVTYNSSSPVHHIKFIKCGAYDAGHFDANNPTGGNGFVIAYANHILFEDCYVFGNFRYGFYAGKAAEQIIFRRCVARIDSSNSVTGISAFTAYDSRKVEFQNCIAIDMDNANKYYLHEGIHSDAHGPRGFMVRDTGDGYDTSEIYIRGGIVLNMASGTPMMGTSGGTPNVQVENTVFWHSHFGSRLRSGGVAFNKCTFGDIDGTDAWLASAIAIESGSKPVTNSIFYGILHDYAAEANGSYSSADYNCFFNNPAGNFASNWDRGPHTLCSENGSAIDPIDGSPGNGKPALKYLVRIEDGSDLKGAASDGGDIGATILYKIGRDGTLWGDPGYNEVTNESLWPFPNEDLIKQQMSQYSYDADGDGNPEITGKRGFCADGNGLYGGPITLTSYIWEYLGNPCPAEICGGSGGGSENNPPTANAGSDQTITDTDGNGNEQVTLDGSGSSDAVQISVNAPSGEEASTITKKINFQPAGRPIPDGFEADYGYVWDAGRGYGWDADVTGKARDKAVNPDQLLDTYIYADDSVRTWETALPNGTYHVSLSVGEPEYYRGNHKVILEGEQVIYGSTAPNEYITVENHLVDVEDGRFTVQIGGGVPIGGQDPWGLTDLNYIIIEGDSGSALPPPDSLVARPESSIDLSWSSVTGAVGYNVYRSTTHGSGYVKINSDPVAGTSYVDENTIPGATYYYVVTSLNSDGVESAYSPEASATEPLAPPANQPPVIPSQSFTATPSSLNNPGETTTFNVSATDPDGDSLTYTINFGDGTANGSGSQVVHTYKAVAGEDPPYIYTATVTVSDGHGHSVGQSLQVTVNDIPPAEPTNVSAN